MSQLTFFQNAADPKIVNKTNYNGKNYLTHLTYGDKNIVPCDIVFPCSTMRPTFLVGSQYFDFKHCNYLYCDTFGRYYFITDAQLLNNGMVQLQCKVDVLYSFKDAIYNLYTVVARQEDKQKCNPYIPDELIVGRVDRQVIKKQIGAVGGNATGTHIVLTVTGGE